MTTSWKGTRHYKPREPIRRKRYTHKDDITTSVAPPPLIVRERKQPPTCSFCGSFVSEAHPDQCTRCEKFVGTTGTRHRLKPVTLSIAKLTNQLVPPPSED